MGSAAQNLSMPEFGEISVTLQNRPIANKRTPRGRQSYEHMFNLMRKSGKDRLKDWGDCPFASHQIGTDLKIIMIPVV